MDKWKAKRSKWHISEATLLGLAVIGGCIGAWLAKGASWADKRISVRALGSTDSGVSWIVETEGKRIFHAGDLCNWYARFLTDAVPGQTIYSEEFEEYIDPIAHEKQYLGELKDIRKVADSFDLVMFPVDGRIGNGYTMGIARLNVTDRHSASRRATV